MRKKINMVPVPKLKKLIQGTGTKINQLTKAFTLVELIVVITILAILATVGFVSFSGYLAGTRDTNRIAQLKSMSDALELYRTKKDLPIPDDKVDVKVGTGSNEKTIAYQGYIGKNVLETIEYTESGLDPKDKNYFSYYLTKNKKYFQLLSFLEEPSEDIVAINNKRPVLGTKNIALKTGLREIDATDYSERYPKTTGKKLGILTDENNTPIQEIPAITGSGYLDLNNVGTTVYKTIIDNDEIISGSGTTLAGTNPKASCKRIKQLKGSSDDGIYIIDPNGDGIGFKVYCDMTTDGGGWTLVVGIEGNNKKHSNINSVTPENLTSVNGKGKLSDVDINLLAQEKVFRLTCHGSTQYFKDESKTFRSTGGSAIEKFTNSYSDYLADNFRNASFSSHVGLNSYPNGNIELAYSHIGNINGCLNNPGGNWGQSGYLFVR